MTGAPTGSAESGVPEHRLTLAEVVPLLVRDGLLAADQAPAVDGSRLQSLATHPLVWLAQRQLPQPNGAPLDLATMTQWLAGHVGLPYFAIDPLKLDVDRVTREVSRSYTARYGILPVAVDDQSVTFATAEPYERRWEDEMSHVLKREVRRVISLPTDIARYQDELFGVSQSIRKAAQVAGGDPLGINNLEALVQLGRSGKLDANDRHVVTIVDWLLQYAFDQRASDIHLEPRRGNGNVRFRIDGVLHTVYQIPTTILGAVTSRIKALGRMDVVEKRRPQDGRVKSKTPQGNEIELRLSTMPTAFGEKLVMRIFDPQVLVRDPEQLGFGRRDARLWREMTEASHGIILVTGPTGSGKTT
ncbi:MAG: Flp pilus assembly complex ATPase component TadA, partial [Gammaproteobacteria bacterium]|nr:Flp pilus assembly complex ATPase component TadA [Gammaproteobacteria bacterium]